jgi:hypothetical protein
MQISAIGAVNFVRAIKKSQIYCVLMFSQQLYTAKELILEKNYNA